MKLLLLDEKRGFQLIFFFNGWTIITHIKKIKKPQKFKKSSSHVFLFKLICTFDTVFKEESNDINDTLL
jgi:hypothetical protein